MECIKEKRFLFWKHKVVEHNYDIKYISKFMDSSTSYHVHYECSVCGATKIEKFVSKDSLIMCGIPVPELEKIDSKRWYNAQKGKTE